MTGSKICDNMTNDLSDGNYDDGRQNEADGKFSNELLIFSNWRTDFFDVVNKPLPRTTNLVNIQDIGAISARDMLSIDKNVSKIQMKKILFSSLRKLSFVC